MKSSRYEYDYILVLTKSQYIDVKLEFEERSLMARGRCLRVHDVVDVGGRAANGCHAASRANGAGRNARWSVTMATGNCRRAIAGTYRAHPSNIVDATSTDVLPGGILSRGPRYVLT